MVGAHNLCYYYVYSSFIHSQPLLEESVNCLMHISDPITCVRLLCPDCIGKAIKVINNKELEDDLILDEDKHINITSRKKYSTLSDSCRSRILGPRQRKNWLKLLFDVYATRKSTLDSIVVEQDEDNTRA